MTGCLCVADIGVTSEAGVAVLVVTLSHCVCSHSHSLSHTGMSGARGNKWMAVVSLMTDKGVGPVGESGADEREGCSVRL